jgi:hypothetical protein
VEYYYSVNYNKEQWQKWTVSQNIEKMANVLKERDKAVKIHNSTSGSR